MILKPKVSWKKLAKGNTGCSSNEIFFTFLKECYILIVMRKVLFCIIPLILISLASCQMESNDSSSSYTVITAPKNIKVRAFRFAELYRDSDTEYELGGQMPVRAAIKIDCSGLVIMCYKYALVDTKYQLLEDDMAAAYIYEHASVPTKTPEQGDLIFMGSENPKPEEAEVSHIAFFDRQEDGEIYFIDSTKNDSVNGVTERHYPVDSKKFKAFGIMKIKY